MGTPAREPWRRPGGALSFRRTEVGGERDAELERVRERIDERGRKCKPGARGRRGEEHHEEAEQLEEHSERLHSGGREVTGVLPRAPQYEVECMDTDPQDGGERPGGDVPVENQEQRQGE